jgi:hypothetical protein
MSARQRSTALATGKKFLANIAAHGQNALTSEAATQAG